MLGTPAMAKEILFEWLEVEKRWEEEWPAREEAQEEQQW